MEKSSKVFVGMDVHKESIDITLAEPGREVHRLGQIGGDRGCLLTFRMTRRQAVGVDAAVSGHVREIASNKDAAHGVQPRK
jgi:hypothetical protein